MSVWSRVPRRGRILILTVFYGVLFTISHPDVSLWWTGWIALVPLFLALREAQSWKSAAAIGWLGGFFAHFGNIGWLYCLGVFTGIDGIGGYVFSTLGAVLLAGYLAVYTGLFGALSHWLTPRPGWRFVGWTPFLWVLCEWLRSWMLTGFPWGSVGHTQWNNHGIAQLASLGGVPLVSLVVVYANAAIANVLLRLPDMTRAQRETIPAVIVLVLSAVYGAASRNMIPPPVGTIKAAVVPGNIPQLERWKRSLLSDNLTHYLTLMRRAAEQKPDVIVLPETSVLYFYLQPEDRERFHQTIREMNIPLLFGQPIVSRRGTLREGHNAAIVMLPDGSVAGQYNKQHLVPFGEYIPFREILPKFLTEKVIGVADYNFGQESNVLALSAGGTAVRIGVPICFESVFAEISREFSQNGANVLAVLTNDGWYEGTAAIAQHNVFSVFRAIETRRAVIRAANRGISCVIDPSGRISGKTIPADDMNDVLVQEVPLMTGTTPFVVLGDWVSYASVLAAVGMAAFTILRRGKSNADDPLNEPL